MGGNIQNWTQVDKKHNMEEFECNVKINILKLYFLLQNIVIPLWLMLERLVVDFTQNSYSIEKMFKKR